MKIHESRGFEHWAPVLGRILLGALFLVPGIMKITGFAGTVAFTASVGVPFPTIAVILAIIIEVGAGALLILGIWSRVAAWVLFLFLIPVTMYFHTGFAEDPSQMTQFLKNLGIMGGLLYVSVYGAQIGALKKCKMPHMCAEHCAKKEA